MDSFVQDLRYALRVLLNSPGFTAVAVLTLALGIGANTAMFSVLNAVLLRQLPFRDPATVMVVSQNMQDGNTNLFTTDDFLAWKQQGGDLAGMAAFVGHTYNFSGEALPERIPGSQVSHEIFSVTGVEPILGRAFTPEEDRLGGPSVVLLSYSLWKDRFGGDPNILGRAVMLDGAPAVAVGVMPAGFHLFNQSELLWTPLRLAPSASGKSSNVHWLVGLMRLPSGSSQKQVTARLNAVAERLHHDDATSDAGFGVAIQDVRQYLAGGLQPILALLMGAAGLVLLIACSNVANLLLARGSARRREISIRTALGAPRGRIVRQLLTESCLLALAGGAAGVALAYLMLPVVLASRSTDILGVAAVKVDLVVLACTLLLSVVSGVLFGSAPAMNASGVAPHEVLKDGASGSGRVFGRYRIALIVVETALASVLLIASGLAVKSLWLLTSMPPGFNPHGMLTFQVSAPGHLSANEIPAFYQRVFERISALPGIQSAMLARDLPMSGIDPSMPIAIEGQAPPVTPGQIVTRFRTVGPGYFGGMETPLLRGREFNDADTASSLPVVVISQTLAQRYWPNEDPVGKRLKPQIADAPWYTVVGVTADVHHWTADVRDYEPTAYYPFTQVPLSVLPITEGNHMTFAIRTGTGTMGLASAIQNAVASVDKSVPVYNIKTMDSVVDDASLLQHFDMSLLGTFAALALALAAIGVYGVMAYSVAQRTREIGIRIALGAQTRDVLRLIVFQGARIAAAGIFIGLLGAAALGRLLSSLIYGISPRDSTIFAAVPAILLTTILMACYVPARRAARVDPIVALRIN